MQPDDIRIALTRIETKVDVLEERIEWIIKGLSGLETQKTKATAALIASLLSIVGTGALLTIGVLL